ncbi:hypothetical protein [Streptomyces varsoviensis]|uniref:hypothetical protein n=1 Tax=Streptomyces varsoviensis TaxID=67373 RepID=UPI000AEE02FF|nr:hypothetical protein [Streptomyces varsoviensis]
MVTLAPRGRYSAGEPRAAEISDVMWVFATPEAQLEHVSIRSGACRIHLGFYSRLDSAAAAEATTAICRRALASSPLLRGWEVAALGPAPEGPGPGPDPGLDPAP